MDKLHYTQKQLFEIQITNPNIVGLKDNEIFVFGSNEAGKHGKGAAKQALKWGAIYYNPSGLQGCTYALPTKNKYMKTLSILKIKECVNELLETVKLNPYLHFLITEIGCGLAGYKPSEIAPLFVDFIGIKNISMPEKFIDVLKSELNILNI